ncbi:DUF4159 domain-containing protein [Maricaulis sp.]|uniref:DUF4159 domain-containing protein n=1 Tax=Maricaulis sp. TaxID=1486257 RepID=UPI003A8E0C76
MFALGPLSFGAPLALIGLLSLPVLWLLLRATPPAPKRAIFPPLRLLFGAPDDAETPQHAPWWLILFRLLIATLIILGLSRPVWTPPAVVTETRPELIVIDNGWAASANWGETSREAIRLLDEAERDGRLAAIAFTANSGEAAAPVRLDRPDAARRLLASAGAMAWNVDRQGAADRIAAARNDGALTDAMAVTWLSDGIDSAGSRALARTLSGLGDVRIIEPDNGRAALAMAPPEATASGLSIELRRVSTGLLRTAAITALGSDGRAIARTDLDFEAGSGIARAELSLPLDLRNRIASLRVEGPGSAGAIRLMGDQWRRPRVGLIDAPSEDGQPLLSDLHYVESAIAPFSQPVRGTLDELLETESAALVMVDDARTDDDRIADFVANGGLLIRFAGPRLAARSDSLLPVDLRIGGRLLGGALNWEEPQLIARFGDDSPFAGLPTDPTATVDRQVLAQPGTATPDRVWARLEDGTPLVTAVHRGRGWIVLFHVTAGPEWSDLPLSGLYPRMLQRVLGLAQGGPSTGPASGAWVLDRALDAQGQLTTAPNSARPVAATSWDAASASPISPPGLYRLGSATAALNVIRADTAINALPRDLPGVQFAGLDGPRPLRFIAGLLTAALIMLALDVVLALALAGRLPLRLFGAAATAWLIALALPLSPAAEAQPATAAPAPVSDDAFALQAALDLHFAYVITGNASVDARSEAGLTGLSQEVTRRSAIEPAPPMGINVETDPLIFFPMIYWPVARDAPALSHEAAARVSSYLQSGGLIVFDTQDADIAMLRAGAPHPGLLTILDSIDVPPLGPVPPDHVLTRSFYLLQEFPGRFSGAPVWVEANPDGASRDGTSGVIIGANDWASAWAVDAQGRPSAPVEGGDRQRELAIRFGVNIAMYALTGNYKADQVHVPDILERLGQ